MKKLSVLFCIALVTCAVYAQDPAPGFPPYGTFSHGSFDSVNMGNLNAVFSLPILSLAGRGPLAVNAAITHNTSIWGRAGYGSGPWVPAGNFGWSYTRNGPLILYDEEIVTCEESEETAGRRFNFRFVEPDGTTRAFDGEVYELETDCGYSPVGVLEGDAMDGSGYFLVSYMEYGTNYDTYVYSPSGHKVIFYQPGKVYDTNGNYLDWGAWWNSPQDVYDTAGRLALRIVKTSSYWDFQVKDVNGGTQTYRLNFQTRQVKTNFGCAGATEYTWSSASLPVSFLLPNGQSYTFTYEDTPGYPGWTTARLKRVTLPTGGYYEYIYTGPNMGVECTQGTTVSMTRYINDGSSTQTWQYSRVKLEDIIWPNPGWGRRTWKTTATPPTLPYDSAANQSTFTFKRYGYGDPIPFPGATHETVGKYFQGLEASNQLLRTVTSYRANIIPLATITALDTNQQSKVEFDYGAGGVITETRQYEFGSGGPGPLVRRTTNTYLSGTEYANRKIRDRLTETLVKDGSANIVSRTAIAYDTTTLLCVEGTIPHHDDTNYGCTLNYRGNPTAVTRYLNPSAGNGPVTATFVFDSLGNLRSTTDPGGHTTTFSYTDNYADIGNQNSYVYVTEVTKPAPFNSQKITTQYYYHIGAPSAVTDENSRVTSFSYLDGSSQPDKFNRLRKVTSPDGGETTVAYDDVNRTVTTTQKRAASESIASTAVFNILGQLVQTQMPGSRKVDYLYDTYGRQWKVSNLYVTTGDPTYGISETRLDALGRVREVINQDFTHSVVEYSGNAVRATDETSKKKINEFDALGRLTKVCEVTAGNTRDPADSCAITYFGGTGYLSTHSYDALDNLTQTVQRDQTRSNTFDGLGRMTSSRILEVSTSVNVSYGYDADGNQISQTDPRGTVNLEYDELHRLKRKKYGTTLVAEFTYDGTQANNAIGRLVAEWDGPAGSADKTEYTYDTLGRALTANRTSSGTTYAMGYTYDYMGNLTSISYPSTSGTRRKVDYVYNANAELNRVADPTATSFDYVTGTAYASVGTIQQVNFGNGVSTTLGWTNPRILSTSLVTQKQGVSAYLNLGYAYYANGQIWKIKYNQDEEHVKSEEYTYDDLHRLFTAQRGPDNDIQRKYEYEYDRYGNRWEQKKVAGEYGYSPQFGYNTADNRVISPTGFSYTEGAVTRGNLTANGPGTSYTYNQENLMLTAGASTYAYDAQGRRVRKTVSGVTTAYFYSGSEIIAEWNPSAADQPMGWVDGAVDNADGDTSLPQGGTLRVNGWALDIGDGRPAHRVEVRIDGVVVGFVVPTQSRQDIADVFGLEYLYSGWTLTVNIGNTNVGAHTVTAVAFDSAEASAVLGSGLQITVTASGGSGNPPTGYTDVAVDPGDNDTTLVQGTTLFVAGWACDPETYAPVSRVEVTIDGVVVGTATLGGERPDVAAVLGSQCLLSGWTWTGNIRSLEVGTRTVTAVAFDSGNAAAVLGAGQSITVTAAPPPGWTDYIFFGGLRIAKQTGSTASTAVYFHSDHLGSIRVTTDANGNSTGTCDFEPFGEFQPPSQSTCSALPTNFRFAGRLWDPESAGHGLYHIRSRQYDPAQGRWMTVGKTDARFTPPSSNRYAYFSNDVVNDSASHKLELSRPVMVQRQSQQPHQPQQPPAVPVPQEWLEGKYRYGPGFGAVGGWVGAVERYLEGTLDPWLKWATQQCDNVGTPPNQPCVPTVQVPLPRGPASIPIAWMPHGQPQATPKEKIRWEFETLQNLLRSDTARLDSLARTFTCFLEAGSSNNCTYTCSSRAGGPSQQFSATLDDLRRACPAPTPIAQCPASVEVRGIHSGDFQIRACSP